MGYLWRFIVYKWQHYLWSRYVVVDNPEDYHPETLDRLYQAWIAREPRRPGRMNL